MLEMDIDVKRFGLGSELHPPQAPKKERLFIPLLKD